MSISIIFFLIMIIHGEDTFDCTGYEDDSYHSIYDADDCRHYWHCIYVDTVYMHAVKRVCPAGTEFHATLRQCETSSLVDCKPPKSPHFPRTTTTTKAWKGLYSRLFSRKYWKSTTRKHEIFDLQDTPQFDLTTMIMPEFETMEQTQVLSFTPTYPTTVFSLEKLSKDLNALVLNRRPHKHKPMGTNLFQIGEPENEADIYVSTTTETTKRRTRRTRSTTTPIQSTTSQITTQLSLTTFLFTTESTTTTTTTITTTSITMTTPIISSLTSISTSTILTQPDMGTNIKPQPRMSGQRRRNNMTLFILTSDEHKIRQFSVNHTRGILINCNQLRRRLLGRRRLRNILQTTTNHTLNIKHLSNVSIQILPYNILSLICFLTKLFIIT
ncbi:unnamed protein product [Adineta steineri]|uniref:Chitin-binding type-2 domain-containing protein n=1 Tax=Adineta steineri TaxID=433720 RepID=A0A813N0A1_9BILA|nr:unnamed protein product [Adineta steineri]CAF1335489.1 unnamed protein product [Adineta steineri]